MAVVEVADGVVGVLPVLVVQPVAGPVDVLEEPVAVGVRRPTCPGECRLSVRQQFLVLGK
jgi:hypothetical protein